MPSIPGPLLFFNLKFFFPKLVQINKEENKDFSFVSYVSNKMSWGLSRIILFTSTNFSLKEFAISNSSVTSSTWSFSRTNGDFELTLRQKKLNSLKNLFGLFKLYPSFFHNTLFFSISRAGLYRCSSSGF